MAQDLSDDVWSHIAETRWFDPALHNLSLTSRRMRRIFVPVLFRHLEFRGFGASSESLIVQLIRHNMRARFLFNSPELLRHTRSFTLWEHPRVLKSLAEYIALHTGSDDSSSRNDAENFLEVLLDVISRLIFRMPGLRRLYLSNVVMTPLLSVAISSRPLLTSLTLDLRSFPEITKIIPAPPHTLCLHDFAYNCEAWIENYRSPDPYLTDILDHCILTLEKLNIPSVLLSLVASRIPLNRTLSLQSFTVPLPFYDDLAAVAYLQVLRASPQLRNIHLNWELPDIELTRDLLPLSLPNLSTISGTPRLLQLLTGGTNIIKISLFTTYHLTEQPLTRIIRSSPTHLREFFMYHVVLSEAPLETPREFLTFIRSLAVFRNLETLTIAYEHGMPSFPWKNHVSVEDSHSTIKELLSQLTSLRSLDINCNLYGFREGWDVGCPISKEGDAANQGHPSLEAIYVDFLCGMWSWDSRKGWEISDWALP